MVRNDDDDGVAASAFGSHRYQDMLKTDKGVAIGDRLRRWEEKP